MFLRFSFIYFFLFFAFSLYGMCWCGDSSNIDETAYTATTVAQTALYHGAGDIVLDLATGNVAKARIDALSALSYALHHCSKHPDLVARIAADAIDEMVQSEQINPEENIKHINYFHDFFEKINHIHYPQLGIELKNHFTNILHASEDRISHILSFKGALKIFEKKLKIQTVDAQTQTMPINFISDLGNYIWDFSFIKVFLWWKNLFKMKEKEGIS